MSHRIGYGYDIHRLVEGRKLLLGGVQIPYAKGLLGHSDADVLLHAVSDALLGAIAAGDIGEQFPDTDPRYNGIDSAKLLENVLKLVEKDNFKINNIDTVIIAQEPALFGFKEQIKQNLAGFLKISQDRVSVKAKTNEGLGEIGRVEAIAAHAVVSLSPAS